jgi:hypothetical protein
MNDLTFGETKQGDYAFFLEHHHIQPDGWGLDEETQEALGNKSQAIYFKLLVDGEVQHDHGWIENGRIIQWG